MTMKVIGLDIAKHSAWYENIRCTAQQCHLRKGDNSSQPVSYPPQFDRGDHPALPKSLFIRADCSLHVSVSIKRSVAASIAGIALQSSIENVWSSWGLTRMLLSAPRMSPDVTSLI